VGIYDDDDGEVAKVKKKKAPSPVSSSKKKKSPSKKKKAPVPKKKRAPAKKKKKQKKKEITPEEFFASIEPVPVYEKHLIECRCYLPQFKNWEEPPNHQFIVFSELDEKARVVPSYAQCNNCGIIHRVQEVGQSITIKKEEMLSLPEIDDYKPSLPEWMVAILEKYECELHVWQEAEFIYRNEQWGKFVVIAKERDNDTVVGKILLILSKSLYKIDTFEQDNPSI
jgi:hypothetical protein